MSANDFSPPSSESLFKGLAPIENLRKLHLPSDVSPGLSDVSPGLSRLVKSSDSLVGDLSTHSKYGDRKLDDDSYKQVTCPWSENFYAIETIGDGSCFIHSVLKCFDREYQNAKTIGQRLLIAYKVRFEMFKMLAEPNTSVSETQAKINVWGELLSDIPPEQIERMYDDYNPEDPDQEKFNRALYNFLGGIKKIKTTGQPLYPVIVFPRVEDGTVVGSTRKMVEVTKDQVSTAYELLKHYISGNITKEYIKARYDTVIQNTVFQFEEWYKTNSKEFLAKVKYWRNGHIIISNDYENIPKLEQYLSDPNIAPVAQMLLEYNSKFAAWKNEAYSSARQYARDNEILDFRNMLTGVEKSLPTNAYYFTSAGAIARITIGFQGKIQGGDQIDHGTDFQNTINRYVKPAGSADVYLGTGFGVELLTDLLGVTIAPLIPHKDKHGNIIYVEPLGQSPGPPGSPVVYVYFINDNHFEAMGLEETLADGTHALRTVFPDGHPFNVGYRDFIRNPQKYPVPSKKLSPSTRKLSLSSSPSPNPSPKPFRMPSFFGDGDGDDDGPVSKLVYRPKHALSRGPTSVLRRAVMSDDEQIRRAIALSLGQETSPVFDRLPASLINTGDGDRVVLPRFDEIEDDSNVLNEL